MQRTEYVVQLRFCGTKNSHTAQEVLSGVKDYICWFSGTIGQGLNYGQHAKYMPLKFLERYFFLCERESMGREDEFDPHPAMLYLSLVSILGEKECQSW